MMTDTVEYSDMALIYQDRPRPPGVYYETSVVPGPGPVFRTGVPVFVGFIESLKFGKWNDSRVFHLDRWAQFHYLFVPLRDSYLAHAVRGFFANGGEHCVVLPILGDKNHSTEMTNALLEIFAGGGALDNLEDIDLVCVPDAMLGVTEKKTDHAGAPKIQAAMLEHCYRMGDRFAILDGYEQEATSKTTRVQDPVLHWQSLPRQYGAYGALYYPWISVREANYAIDSERSGTTAMPCGRHSESMAMEIPGFMNFPVNRPVPPCGHIAGIYSRSDARVGVHKAPANELLEEVIELTIDYGNRELAVMNEAGINCLNSAGGRGIRVWGARTLSGQPDQSYVNVRRLFLTLTRWLRKNMEDLAFETNDQRLWERIRERITDYCRRLFDQGALKGSNPAQAFFVKCDAETNPPERQEAGEVIAEVGLAPATPVEFIVVRITQRASTLSVTGLNV